MASGSTKQKLHRSFRRFVRETGETNFIRGFIEWQKATIGDDRSRAYWAERWGVSQNLVVLWALPLESAHHRRPGPEQLALFNDLRDLAGVTMDEFFRATPASVNPNQPLAERGRKRPAGRGESVARARGGAKDSRARK